MLQDIDGPKFVGAYFTAPRRDHPHCATNYGDRYRAKQSSRQTWLPRLVMQDFARQLQVQVSGTYIATNLGL